MTPAAWTLKLELAAWRRAGRRPRLWWRDDDAGLEDSNLELLLDLASETGVPIALAVIPAEVSTQTVVQVNACRRATVLQHGVDHRNAEADTAPRQFPRGEAPNVIAQKLIDGAERLNGFNRRLPVYVPPWNAFDDNLLEALPLAGLEGLSAFGDARSCDVVVRVDAHLDILRWAGGARFKGEGRLLGRLTRLLAARRRTGAWDEPIGLLSHHRDHDPAAWRFLALFLTNSLEWADWLDAGRLFSPQSQPRMAHA
ncbi:polysaccharide deacetylase [Caulobacter segnis]|uniref:polysaccharide deacetylase n=1 Tax=Caulobacter segnis TaxID=88688 RepID=UPI00240FC824|nr:polysaccharide deacetylase [Caulobacter segnis]MDG2520404.1 polysaccharide deacetylase [Caulobacter segnis]